MALETQNREDSDEEEDSGGDMPRGDSKDSEDKRSDWKAAKDLVDIYHLHP